MPQRLVLVILLSAPIVVGRSAFPSLHPLKDEVLALHARGRSPSRWRLIDTPFGPE
jgi:hypothetical protein